MGTKRVVFFLEAQLSLLVSAVKTVTTFLELLLIGALTKNAEGLGQNGSQVVGDAGFDALGHKVAAGLGTHGCSCEKPCLVACCNLLPSPRHLS